jgi:hypothetical protein
MISHANLVLSPSACQLWTGQPIAWSRRFYRRSYWEALLLSEGRLAYRHISQTTSVCVCGCVSGRVKENREKDVEPQYTDIDKYLSIYDNWWYYVILQQQKLSKPGYPLKFHEIKLLSLRL